MFYAEHNKSIILNLFTLLIQGEGALERDGPVRIGLTARPQADLEGYSGPEHKQGGGCKRLLNEEAQIHLRGERWKSFFALALLLGKQVSLRVNESKNVDATIYKYKIST